jgi:hypothetical protein
MACLDPLRVIKNWFLEMIFYKLVYKKLGGAVWIPVYKQVVYGDSFYKYVVSLIVKAINWF